MKERHLFWILFGLLAVSLFVNIGVNPLYLEEPRRALIATEMFLQNNLFVPTQYGEFYYRKPPVFNWVILSSLRMFPGHPEFACRLVSVVSFLLMGLLTFFFCKKFHSEKLGQMASLTLLTAVHFLFYGSLFAEIDLFYSLITYTSILALYVFHQKGNKLLYFGIIYGLSAIGLLTKGAPSIVFLGLSLGVHLFYTKRLKWLLSWQHFVGLALFVGILGSYAWAYSQYNSLEPFIAKVWIQASGRTTGGSDLLRLVKHVLTYPLELLIDLLPIGLFIPFLFVKGVFRKMMSHPMMKFVAVLFTVNIILYWASVGTRSRYVYMLYPLAVIICSWLFLQASEKIIWVEKALRILNLVIVFLLLVGFIALPVISSEIGIQPTFMIVGGSIVALVGIGFDAYRNQSLSQMWWLIALLIFARFQFDMLLLPARAAQGEHMDYRVHGVKIAELTKGSKLWLYKYNIADEASLKFGHSFYIEWNRQDVLKSITDRNCEDYFLVLDEHLDTELVDVIYEFDRRERHWTLLKFTDCD